MADSEILERPSAAALAQVAPAAPLTITETIRAQFAAIEPDIRSLAARYENVAFDVSTPKGLADAKAARHDLRENGRFFLNRALDAKKREVNDGKKLLEAETERLVAIIAPVEAGVHKQIEAEETRKAAEKAERERVAAEAERAAAERKAGFEAEIAKIHANVDKARGLPAYRIANGIALVEAMAFGEEWAEFAEPAAKAQAETVAELRKLHAETLAQEQAAAEAEALRIENERKAAELAQQQASIRLQQRRMEDIQRINAYVPNAQAAIIGKANGEAANLLSRMVDALAGMDVTSDGCNDFGEFAPMAATARDMVLAQLRSMLAEAQAKAAREAEVAAAEAARAAAEAQAAQDASEAQSPTEAAGEAMRPLADVLPEAIEHIEAPQAPEAFSVNVIPATPEQHAQRFSPRVEVTFHEPLAGPFIDLKPIDEPAGEGFTADPVAELLAHIATLDSMPFASHPKPPKSWFDRLRVLAAEVGA